MTFMRPRPIFALLMSLFLGACNGDPEQYDSTIPIDSGMADVSNSDPADTGNTSPEAMTVGPAGGDIAGPGGIIFSVPPNALSAEITIQISAVEMTSPLGLTAISSIYRFEPAGQTFLLPVTVSIPAADANANVYWTRPNSAEFTRLASTWSNGTVTAEVNHFSLGFAGLVRSAGYCKDVYVSPDCTVTGSEGDPSEECDVLDEGGQPLYQEHCFSVYDGHGNPMPGNPGVCRFEGCQGVEGSCLDGIDNDCDGLVDHFDADCASCMVDTDCNAGLGAYCSNGFCKTCNDAANECSEPNGTPGDACVYDVGEQGATEVGLCMHSVDSSGATCETTCREDTVCAADEICGNRVDDDCDGLVDNGCPERCSTDSNCLAGEICSNGHCVSCPNAIFEDHCSANADHGETTPACSYTLDEGQSYLDGTCLHMTDVTGAVCGSRCLESQNCQPVEICFNHRDDNCDGQVDEGCTPCSENADCLAGQYCNRIY